MKMTISVLLVGAAVLLAAASLCCATKEPALEPQAAQALFEESDFARVFSVGLPPEGVQCLDLTPTHYELLNSLAERGFLQFAIINPNWDETGCPDFMGKYDTTYGEDLTRLAKAAETVTANRNVEYAAGSYTAEPHEAKGTAILLYKRALVAVTDRSRYTVDVPTKSDVLSLTFTYRIDLQLSGDVYSRLREAAEQSGVARDGWADPEEHQGKATLLLDPADGTWKLQELDLPA